MDSAGPARRGHGQPHGRRRLFQPDLRHHHALLRPPARDQGHRQLLPLRRQLHDRDRVRAGRLQPARRVAAAQVRDHHPADRRGAGRGDHRSRHHAAGDPRDRRPLPRRGRALDLEHVSRDRALRGHLLGAHRPCPRRRPVAGGKPGGRVIRRAGDLLDARHRRRPSGPPAAASPKPRSRREAAGRAVPHAPQPRRRPRAAGRHDGAAARPSGADPPGHPDHDHAGRGADHAVRHLCTPF